jgi:hypothetical protein
MPGLCRASTSFFVANGQVKTWMAGTSPAMTVIEKRLLTSAVTVAISTPPGTSGLLAFERGFANDGIDQIERRAR